ncbi:MAG: hypothetical protein LLF83_05260 [Methanobacterium sp.]|nr:hypothetical protein [Methanobacterium sp.]
MVKKILEDISHFIHTAYESIERIIIALAKKMGISRKTQSAQTSGLEKQALNLMKIRSAVLATFVVVSVIVIGVNGVDMTSIQDKGTLSLQKQPIPIGATMCANCNGTGKIKEEYNVTESVPCDNPNCKNGQIQKGYDEFIYLDPCDTCGGDGFIEKTITKIRYLTCPVCNGKGYLMK